MRPMGAVATLRSGQQVKTVKPLGNSVQRTQADLLRQHPARPGPQFRRPSPAKSLASFAACFSARDLATVSSNSSSGSLS